MAQKIKKFILSLVLLAPLLITLPAFAASTPPNLPVVGTPPGAVTNSGAGSSSTDVGTDCAGESPENCLSNQPFISDINAVVDVLTALVGVVVVGVIILGGIQYSAAGDNPQAVSAARKRITNGLIALIAFLLTAAFLQWVIPGGLFNS